MFGWFKKKQSTKKPQDNIYTVLNAELARMHSLIQSSLANSGENVNIFYTRIKDIQDAILEALEKQPSHHNEIVDLQETVSELILLGNQGEQKES